MNSIHTALRFDPSADATIPKSPWTLLTPQTRVMCVLLMLMAIALTPNAHWWTWGLYGMVILVGLWISRVSWVQLCQRLAVETLFISVILLGTLLHPGQDILWQWGWLKITTTGLIILGSVTSKFLLSLMLLNLLTFTTPIPILLQSLQALKVPPLLIAILAAMYRYLDVLMDEFTVMRRAAVSRNLLAGRHWQRLVIGNMIGSLFIRTYDRGDRIYQAMLARGYQGLIQSAELPRFQGCDPLALQLTILVIMLGQLIYWI
ncbi:MAG: cobalt ECF transporter T component CbiQ [Synechococcales bacterium]|nr:cobalt ECF transporter T component CbiQ [Synechococcales bacterium]